MGTLRFGLPLELWLKIFKMVVRLPGDCIDPAPPYRVPASPHQWPSDIWEKSEKREMALTLLRVCRTWNQIAVEVCYTIVHVYQRFQKRSSSRAVSLRIALQNSHKMDTTGKGGYGRWVKQLCFDMAFCPVNEVVLIVKFCPNLQTLIIDKNNSWTPQQINSLLLPVLSSSKQLRRLEWKGTRAKQSDGVAMSPDMVGLLNACNNIWAYTFTCKALAHPLSIPLFHVLHLTLIEPESEHLAALPHWALPSLTHLTIESSKFGPELTSVIRLFGPQLLFLSLSLVQLAYGDGLKFKLATSQYVEWCLMLREFVLPTIDEDMADHLSSVTITHIVIEPSPGWYDITRAFQKVLQYDLPALKCVRVMAHGGHIQPLDPNWGLDQIAEEYSARGISIEDADGMPLPIALQRSM